MTNSKIYFYMSFRNVSLLPCLQGFHLVGYTAFVRPNHYSAHRAERAKLFPRLPPNPDRIIIRDLTRGRSVHTGVAKVKKLIIITIIIITYII